jgi:hypothetical protein
MNSYQVAAESVVASLLAQCGYDVLVQYGANQPGYDLVAIKPGRILKVSVKGSQDGGWVLTAGLKTSGNTYHEAADEWLEKHGPDLVFAFVQFKNIELGKMPNVYLARSKEVAAHLKSKKGGTGDTRFAEYQLWKSGIAKGVTDEVPEKWKFTQKRIDSV